MNDNSYVTKGNQKKLQNNLFNKKNSKEFIVIKTSEVIAPIRPVAVSRGGILSPITDNFNSPSSYSADSYFQTEDKCKSIFLIKNFIE